MPKARMCLVLLPFALCTAFLISHFIPLIQWMMDSYTHCHRVAALRAEEMLCLVSRCWPHLQMPLPEFTDSYSSFSVLGRKPSASPGIWWRAWASQLHLWDSIVSLSSSRSNGNKWKWHFWNYLGYIHQHCLKHELSGDYELKTGIDSLHAGHIFMLMVLLMK